jgi:hypothetical protein
VRVTARRTTVEERSEEKFKMLRHFRAGEEGNTSCKSPETNAIAQGLAGNLCSCALVTLCSS